ncbi:hypothetical protein [Thiofilum flexile]|uniref:hypothetical protein n=1 Tax=Thiofilum flexile TaxID=125627 RepID=UPI0003790E19|nr:hypothetical protein [Thiofilum flexile]
MKKLTAIAALLASTLGMMGTAQAGNYNQVTLQAVPAHAKVVVVDARHARNVQRMHNNHRQQMARAAHHQRKAANTVKIVVVKPRPVVKKVVYVRPAPVVKKVVYVRPAPVVKKVVYVQQRPVHRPAVVDRVVYRTATTNAAPIRHHHY